MFKQREDHQKGKCPFNENHVFAKEKLMFHINRCKDREKVGHLFARCSYNSLHFIRKEDLQKHEIQCPDRNEVTQLTTTMRRNFQDFNRSNRERERSRQKSKEKEEPVKSKRDEEREDDEHTLSECEECQALLSTLNIEDHPKLKKYLQMYEQVCKGDIKSK